MEKSKRKIKVRSVGTPNVELAAELFTPLFLKIHTRDQANRLTPAHQHEQSAASCAGEGRK